MGTALFPQMRKSIGLLMCGSMTWAAVTGFCFLLFVAASAR